MTEPARWAKGTALAVLTWHNVAGTWCWPDPAGVGPARFARQMRALRRFTSVVPLTPSLRALAAGRPLPPRPLALTFDDGYRDNLELAVPVLRALGLPATVYLVPELLDGTLDPWWERLAWTFATARDTAIEFEGTRHPLTDARARRRARGSVEEALKSRTDAERRAAVAAIAASTTSAGPELDTGSLYLDWDEARELARAGVEIGSHSSRHAILARESTEAQHTDLATARRRLQDGLGEPVDSLAYPNGGTEDYDEDTIAAARAAGHASAVASWGLVNRADTDPFRIRRRLVSPLDSPAVITAGVAYGVRRARRATAHPGATPAIDPAA